MKILRVIVLALLLPGFSLADGQVVRGKKVSLQINNMPEAPDIEKPEIQIISPLLQDDMYYQSEQEELIIYGKVQDKSGVSILNAGAEIIPFNEEGVFVLNLKLKPGQNKIQIGAIDKVDNLGERVLFIDYVPPAPSLADRINEESLYYALIIGIDKYRDNRLNDLDNPINDGRKLREALLTNYSFEPENILFLENATREEIIGGLDDLAKKVTTNDNLLIFYAGHGYWDQKSDNGYWLASDAHRDRKTNWVRNSTVVDYLTEIDSRHTLLIADACFGGAIFKTRSAFNEQEFAYETLYDLPSRKAMTSGTLSEVPDKSAFTHYLIERLTKNPKPYLSSEELYSSFRIAVINNSKALPQYGDIQNVGDEGGDFIFLKRQ